MSQTKYVAVEVLPRTESEEGFPVPTGGNEASQQLIGDEIKPSSKTRKGRIYVERWKRTLYLGSASSIVVLLFNLGFVLWAATHKTLENGRGQIFEGPCKKAHNISIGFHLAINILGTLLLCSSNYAMQCLCAPTRKDIDRAHLQNTWLDIGVPSVRNLSSIPRKKCMLWICLVLTSLPLHLVYNSTVFLTYASYQYEALLGNKPFDSSNANIARLPYDPRNETKSIYAPLLNKAANDKLVQLNNSECIAAYATDFVSNYGNVLLISDDFNSTSADFGLLSRGYDGYKYDDPFYWICINHTILNEPEHRCSYYIPDIQAHTDEWTVDTSPADTKDRARVKYCLAESVPEKCKVEYSLDWAIVVIVFNFIKAAIICGVALFLRDIPILTVGDAIASFMGKPDQTTIGNSLLSRTIVRKKARDDPLRFSWKPRRWASAVSTRRWGMFLLFYAISLITSIGLLAHGFKTQITDPSIVWKASLGTPNSQTMISTNYIPPTLLSNTIVANIPQTIFSVLYFTSNGIFTSMALASEWSKYAHKRKGLRVSTPPRGSQRSAYFLTLPYRYAIPLLVFSSLMHWLISQSLFLVSVEAYDPPKTYNSEATRAPNYDQMTCGYSPVAIVSSLAVGVTLVVYIGSMGLRRLKSGMPVAGSCSLAISAACHPHSDFSSSGQKGTASGGDYAGDNSTDSGKSGRTYTCSLDKVESGYTEKEPSEIGTLPLQWGHVSAPYQGDTETPHCSFSSDHVQMPIEGAIYK